MAIFYPDFRLDYKLATLPRKDAHDREAIVAHLKQQLHSGDKSLVGNKGYGRYLKVEGGGHPVIGEKQVKAEERYDGIGCYVLASSTIPREWP